MKKLCLILTLLLALTISGCGTGNITSNTTENVTVTPASGSPVKSGITEEAAADILTEYLKTIGISKEDDPNLSIALDRTEEADGKKYYVFQVFDDMEAQTATLGWYGVQINDGSVYDFLLMESVIAPVD